MHSMQNLTAKAEERPMTKAKGFPLPVWGRGKAGQSSMGQCSGGEEHRDHPLTELARNIPGRSGF